MLSCAKCGKVNREGSLFCQDCGNRLAAPKPVEVGAPEALSAASSASTGAATLSCASCGTVNSAGMNFCKMCGTPLAKPAPVSKPKEAPEKISCRACGKLTPAGFAFCQHCGTRIEVSAPAAVSTANASGATAAPAAPSVAAEPDSSAPRSVASGLSGAVAAGSPTPPAGVIPGRVVAAPAAAPAKVAMAPSRPSAVELSAVARPSAVEPAAVARPSAVEPAAVARPSAVEPAAVARPSAVEPSPTPRVESSAPVLGRLIPIRRDGADGESLPLVGSTVDVGRSEGGIRFAEDPHLASRHVRFSGSPGQVTMTPLDQVNGVYIRVRAPIDLQPGDQIFVGKQLFRLEPVAPEERQPPTLVEHGVRLMGSIPKEAWARLKLLTTAGTARDVWYLTQPTLTLGREEGTMIFPDDEFMSRVHLTLRRVGSRVRLEDQGSSNGTFVRVRGERLLEAGDILRIGEQVLRFDAGGPR
jgi:pSer/pThr/pTyr-binding forkhead associated (FHA) protein